MKKALLSIGSMICFTLLSVAQEPATAPVAAPDAPEIIFESETIDYGTIEKDADGLREFKFKNTGKSPLIISSASGSCGCTVPEAPKEPIPAGGTGVIKVKYATDRVGPFTKQVTVNSNAKTPVKVLNIKGEVKAPPAPPTTAATATPVGPVAPAVKQAEPEKSEAAPAKPADKKKVKKKTETKH